ncbi:MAG: hypothetical protein JWQ73_14 [Variovorax sp.]|jgi:hypothetical protein|nr:hypothetical protein [Variovorax sp.]
MPGSFGALQPCDSDPPAYRLHRQPSPARHGAGVILRKTAGRAALTTGACGGFAGRVGPLLCFMYSCFRRATPLGAARRRAEPGLTASESNDPQPRSAMSRKAQSLAR